MNERIRELLNQATEEVDPEDRVWVFSKVDQEKFAENLIRECANICIERKLTPSVFTGEELLEHFGVE
jgi:hypothetical protein